MSLHHKDQLDNTVYGNNLFVVRFEVVTAVVMKSSVFWDIMSYSPLKVN
jgi:hypothetical protein